MFAVASVPFANFNEKKKTHKLKMNWKLWKKYSNENQPKRLKNEEYSVVGFFLLF